MTTNPFQFLRVGKHYRFNFTHKKNVQGVVVELDPNRQRFVVYNTVAMEYEGIPIHRFVSADQSST